MGVEKSNICRCFRCGLVVEVVSDIGAIPSCCGEIMDVASENENDSVSEKHVPVAEKYLDGVKVKIGEIAHPMEDDHYIEWIEIDNGDYVNRYYLAPGKKAEAVFYVPMSDKLVFRAFCNKHGLWKK